MKIRRLVLTTQHISPHFGRAIRAARLAKRLTQTALYRTMRWSPSYLHDIEHGLRLPDTNHLPLLAQTLGLDVDELTVMAGRLPPDIFVYLLDQPLARRLLRRMVDRNIGENGIRALYEYDVNPLRTLLRPDERP